MEITRTLYVTNRDEWRAWLAEHYQTETEVWLIYYKRGSGQPRIPYDDAVEEALCYGWIDSIIQRMDELRYAQKFTPRINRTKWSASNVERMRRLIDAGKMTEAGLAVFDTALLQHDFQPARRDVSLPPALRKLLRANDTAWRNFQALAPSYRKQYAGWITAPVKNETKIKRMHEAISMLEQNKKLSGK
ncbi:MAG: YdeI/OmpD-associated family protein [Chloroflexi bacterium]|nr:YdeI/OmpD-associated family protein [Chloroflexota bacterium]MCL5274021.1 YdeI/OmpD-associated family protein [Chloroflexota bacterium]